MPSDVFSLSFAHFPMALALIGDDFRFKAANERFCTLVRHSWKDLSSRTYGDITHPEDLSCEIQGWLRLEQGASEMSVQKRFLRGDGTTVQVLAHGCPFTDDGAWLGILLAVHVCERTASPVGAEGTRSPEWRLLSQIASLASHDLRQESRMVTTSLGAVSQHHGPGLPQQGRQFLAMALDHAERVGRMIEGMAQYLRVALAQIVLLPVPGDEALDAALAELHPLIAQHSATIIRQPLPVILADRGQLTLLFQYLVENCLIHCGDQQARIVIACHPRGQDWELTISDNGPGIPAELHERVFQPFFTTCGSAPAQRLGLGLALCRLIAERLGGSIGIAVPTDQGTSISIIVKAAAAV